MKKIAIYTSIFGSYDNLSNITYRPENCEFICFTDSDIQSNDWKIVRVSKLYNDPVRDAKRYKILPHRYLSEYDISIYMDGNFEIQENITILVNKYLSGSSAAFFDHNQQEEYDRRNCIYAEADFIINAGNINMGRWPERGTLNYKDNPVIIREQVSRYKIEGYPKNNGLIVGGIILRKHNDIDCINAMESWWNEIKYYSKRDQLSFNYVAWKENFKFNYIPGQTRNSKFFIYRPHDNKK